MTARDLILGSMRLAGILAEGESPSAQGIGDAFSALNDMLSSWSTEKLVVPNVVSETFSLVGGQQTYTMGTGGNFNTTRPQKIENAEIIPPSTTPQIQLPMTVMNKDQFAAIVLKSIQSAIPLFLYNDNANPLTNVSVWPIPNATASIILYSWKPLANLVTVNDTLTFPPGYARALRFNFAREIAAEYGEPLDPGVLMIAKESKENIKRMNSQPTYLVADDGLSIRNKPFNYYTGE